MELYADNAFMPDGSCDEASRLFDTYLHWLEKFQEEKDRMASISSDHPANWILRGSLDLTHDAVVQARQAFFRHCEEHG